MITNYNGSGIDILEQGDEAEWGSEYTKTTKDIIDLSQQNQTQLEKITEGGNTGWSLLGVGRSKKSTIGNGAIDMSFAD